MSAGHQTNTRTCACGALITKSAERCKPCQKLRFNLHKPDTEPKKPFVPETRWDEWRAERDACDPSRSIFVDAIAAKHRSARMPWQE